MCFYVHKIYVILLMLHIRTSAVSEYGYNLAPYTVVTDVQDVRSAELCDADEKREIPTVIHCINIK
jgi:hypothetical protein